MKPFLAPFESNGKTIEVSRYLIFCQVICFSFCSLLISQQVFARASKIPGNMYWEKHYGGKLGEGAFAITSLTRGEMAVAGYTRSYRNGNSDLLVFRLNTKGEQVWQRVLGTTDWESATDIKKTPDGGLVISALQRKRSSKSSDAWIIKLDEKGNTLWEYKTNTPDDEIPYALTILSDGAVIVAGLKTLKTSENSDGWLLKLSATGKPVWNKMYGSTDPDWFRTVARLPNGDLVAAGSARYKEVTSVSARFLHKNTLEKTGSIRLAAWVMRVSSNDGKIKWSRIHQSGRKNAIETATVLPNKNIALAGWSRTTYGKDIWVAVMTSQGEILWQKLYGGAGDDRPGRLVAMPDGKLVLTSVTRKSLAVVTTHTASVFALDKKGVVLWEQAYGKGRSDKIQGITRMGRGKLAVAGTAWRQGKITDAWVFTLSGNGKTPVKKAAIGNRKKTK